MPAELESKAIGKHCAAWDKFFNCSDEILLTARFAFVIIVGFAIKSVDFCPAKALQVVCSVDDGPKTDWQAVCVKQVANAGASWEPI